MVKEADVAGIRTAGRAGLINTSLDMRTDAGGRDADSHSKTLRRDRAERRRIRALLRGTPDH